MSRFEQNGIINVYKEKGYTSHDVVARLRGIIKQKKAGHTGTLDPMAEGVLPVCLGSATKLCGLITDAGKEYEAALLLGQKTDTQDVTGRVIREAPPEEVLLLTPSEVAQAVKSFEGRLEQIPPMYSALKVNGKRLYELAREGKEIERRARTVIIERIDILDISLPVVRIRVKCSKGTYIRTLCEDIGEKLKVGGTMKELVRTASGSFTLGTSHKLSEIEEYTQAGRLSELMIPVWEPFKELKEITEGIAGCPPDMYEKLIKNGNPLSGDMLRDRLAASDGESFRVYDREGFFVGVYSYDKRKDIFTPYMMFL